MKGYYNKFIQEKRTDKSVIDFVLDEEAHQSDDDFNVFDQIAQGIEDHQVINKLSSDFTNKIIKV